ncbi:MAG: redoxin domain-containing protein [Bacteroidia bacterium]|nr:redoxin domain-containing protein [Bacteroidia bacterium]
MKIVFSCIFILLFFCSFSQPCSVEITIKACPPKRAFLLNFRGDDNNLIDSAMMDAGGKYQFQFNNKREAGLYRLFLDKETTVDFIFNKENIKLITHYDNPVDSMQVATSAENKLYYDFLRQDEIYQKKLELVMPLVNYYPKDDKFYKEVAAKYNSLQQERDGYIMSLIKSSPNSFAARIFKIKRTPIVDAGLGEKEKMDFLKAHFWDQVDLNDTLLFRTNAYTSKALSFLVLFNNRRLPPLQQEEAFIQAVDIILPKARAYPNTYDLILNFFMAGFENFKFEKVLAHISANYKAESSCENQERKSTLQKRLDSYQHLAIGKKVPPLKMIDMNNKTVTLDDFTTEYTLILFWASWCPHCVEMFPEIKKMYDSQNPKKIEILAISLDTNKTAWNDYLKKGGYSWINCCDFKSWDGKVADDYCIYATPTMFLLDRKKIILAKPTTLYELSAKIKELNIK